MKEVIKAMFRSVGLDVRRIQRAPEPDGTVPASPRRPIGNIELFLQDIKARGFVPRGIIDVGANLGLWTRMALSVFPDARVLMIEPLDEMQRSLSRLVKERPACSYVNAGAGRQDGESTLTISWNLVSGSFLPDTETELLASGQQRRTRMVTIDTLLRGAFGDFEPDLVKLDIQGFELEALAGAESLFGRTEVFILETSLFSFKPRSPITRECISFMADREYELYDITEYLRRPLDGALGQIDIAFVKRHGMFRRDVGGGKSSDRLDFAGEKVSQPDKDAATLRCSATIPTYPAPHARYFPRRDVLAMVNNALRRGIPALPPPI